MMMHGLANFNFGAKTLFCDYEHLNILPILDLFKKALILSYLRDQLKRD
jgi:hypothetical protein